MVSALTKPPPHERPLFGVFRGNLYIGVTQDMRIKWYDIVSSLLRGEFTMEHHLSERYTCFAVGTTLTQKTDHSLLETTKIQNGNASTTLIALGHEQGHISLFAMAKGILDHQLKQVHHARVNAIVFAQDGTLMYSTGDDQFIVQWDFSKTVPSATKWMTDQGSVKTLLLSKDGQRLYSGGRTIRIWSTETRSMLQELPGHVTNIRELVMDNQERWLISMAENDRFLNVWDIGDGSSKVSSLSLSMDGEPIHVALASLDQNRIFVASLAENGIVYLWNDLSKNLTTSNSEDISVGMKRKPQRKLGTHTKRYDGSVRYVVSDVANKSSIPIFAMEFVVESKDSLGLRLGWGQFVQPHFEQIPLRLFEGDDAHNDLKLAIESENVLTRSSEMISGFLTYETKSSTISRRLKPSSRKVYDEEKTAIITGTASSWNSSVDLENCVHSKVSSMNEESLHSESTYQQQPTIAEKLRELEIEEKAEEMRHAMTQLKGTMTPKANSLQKMLVQALHSNDNQLLEQCLAVKDPIIIQNTVKKLPTAYVLPLLNQIVQKFQMRPNRSMVLTSWIKTVLTLHTAYLMSVPNLVKNLTGLYQTIDSRLTVFERLLRLSGRLDLLMSQITLRARSTKGDNDDDDDDIDSEALNVYREGEEEHESTVSDEDLMTNLMMDDTLIDEEEDLDDMDGGGNDVDESTMIDEDTLQDTNEEGSIESETSLKSDSEESDE